MHYFVKILINDHSCQYFSSINYKRHGIEIIQPCPENKFGGIIKPGYCMCVTENPLALICQG